MLSHCLDESGIAVCAYMVYFSYGIFQTDNILLKTIKDVLGSENIQTILHKKYVPHVDILISTV